MKELVLSFKKHSQTHHDELELLAVGLGAIVIFLLPHLASLL
jgi:hypothetical protein